MTEKDILDLIKLDPWMMKVLATARDIDVKDWAIGAGFVRNKVWDYLIGRNEVGVNTRDIDLVYYDPEGNNELLDEKLSKEISDNTKLSWDIVNEFYAHKWNNALPYTSTYDAISQWPETVTAIGVTMDKSGELHLIAPYGIDDLVNFIVRPTPSFLGKMDILRGRVQKKRWLENWPNIKIIENID